MVKPENKGNSNFDYIKLTKYVLNKIISDPVINFTNTNLRNAISPFSANYSLVFKTWHRYGDVVPNRTHLNIQDKVYLGNRNRWSTTFFWT
jgi:hypothetical protein